MGGLIWFVFFIVRSQLFIRFIDLEDDYFYLHR